MDLALLQLAVAPILICAFYIFIRDKYEKEPYRLLITGLFFGAYLSFPVIALEDTLSAYQPIEYLHMENIYDSYVIAAFSEETIKFIFLFFLTWRNKNLNERFDGIVYSVFISLGFAGVENLLYVFDIYLGGYDTAVYRGLLSVPGHALFGVNMGFYYALGRFVEKKRRQFLLKSLFYTIFIHGTYDFILCYDHPLLMLVFYPFIIYMWYTGLKKMNLHSEASPFKNDFKRKYS